MARHSKETVTSPISPGELAAQQSDPADTGATHSSTRTTQTRGKLRIPTFGSDWNYAIIQGTSASDLSRGPGHYTRTQNPGDKGNFALAGHRVGRGAPFNDLGYLKTCDSIVVETRESW